MRLIALALLLTACAYQTPAQQTTAYMAGVNARLAETRALVEQEHRAANDRFDRALAQTAVGMPLADLVAVWGRPWQAMNQVQAGGPPVHVLSYCRHAQTLGICYRGRAPAIYLRFADGILVGWTTY